MAKVIGFSPVCTYQCTCTNCSAIIEYTLAEVIKGVEYDYLGGSDWVRYLVCPSCSNKITKGLMPNGIY